MQDVIYLVVMVAFVVVSALFVIGCDKIIGPDDTALAEQGIEHDDEHQEVMA